MLSIGMVAIDQNNSWPGGRYYLQHIIRSVASLPIEDQVSIRDVYWRKVADGVDPFAEVREAIGQSIVVSPPSTALAQLVRKGKRLLKGTVGASDLFLSKGVGCFFPIPPCENTGIPLVYWCPDLQPLRRPDLINAEQLGAFRKELARRVSEAAAVVVSSADARNDLVALYPRMGDRIHIVRFTSVPSDGWFACDPAVVAERYNLPNRFVICCNQFTRHKNHLVLIRALEILKGRGKDSVHLVFTGGVHDYKGEGYFDVVNSAIAKAELTEHASILGFIPREEQIALIRRSIAVAQPSVFEGWSTIVEDAKTLGKELVLSDLPVHREQMAGRIQTFLDPDDPEAWAAALLEIFELGKVGPNRILEATACRLATDRILECGNAFVGAVRSVLGEGCNRNG